MASNATTPNETVSARRRRRFTTGGGAASAAAWVAYGFGNGSRRSLIGSERDADREMQTYLPRLLAVREIETERTARCAHARADAVTDGGPPLRRIVERIARIDERRDAPGLADPPCEFDAR